ncbi:ROK family protein [Actinoplanes sp. TBRC 11911]|uniref:ROK family protein n=1 Tax=Actinoplanes sp. TBRC 11911 TaxID=2729386 RepID=UPI00145F3B75|nr:ROK family protein [Actinoplanes sp. TBRC 11911]NMO49848.1 ROK family protein [Actinoplanes sp. TBRC 11911]
MTVLAVDVGGTTIKGAVADPDGRILHTLTAPTRADDDPVKAVRSLCVQLRDDAVRLGAVPVAIGVVTPGLVDDESGVVRYAANLRFRDVPLRALIGADLELPVAVGHDARAAGVAEAVARGLDDFLLLPLGTGIAAAIVVRGVPLAGATFAAGEVGHMPVYPGGEACSCGQQGCLEVYASAGGLARRYARLSGSSGVDSQAIAALVGTDPVARSVWDDATRALGTALASLTLTLDPARIVLGGGLADAGDLFFTPVRDALRAALAWRSPPPVIRSVFGARAALVGAAVMARREAGLPVPDGWGAPAA